MTPLLTCSKIDEERRIAHVDSIFGLDFPFKFEPFVYSVTRNLSADYTGGYWEFYELSNGGFYMAPDADTKFAVACDNGYEGILTADALGITVCLYGYSHLSFGSGHLAEVCGEQYHQLREFMFEHPEAKEILRATD